MHNDASGSGMKHLILSLDSPFFETPMFLILPWSGCELDLSSSQERKNTSRLLESIIRSDGNYPSVTLSLSLVEASSIKEGRKPFVLYKQVPTHCRRCLGTLEGQVSGILYTDCKVGDVLGQI